MSDKSSDRPCAKSDCDNIAESGCAFCKECNSKERREDLIDWEEKDIEDEKQEKVKVVVKKKICRPGKTDEEHEKEGVECPACGSFKVRKKGIKKGIRRFLCQKCGKWFQEKEKSKIIKSPDPVKIVTESVELSKRKEKTKEKDTLKPKAEKREKKKKMGRPITTDEKYKKLGVVCIKCDSFRIQVGNITDQGVQRYHCMDCGKWFQEEENNMKKDDKMKEKDNATKEVSDEKIEEKEEDTPTILDENEKAQLMYAIQEIKKLKEQMSKLSKIGEENDRLWRIIDKLT